MDAGVKAFLRRYRQAVDPNLLFVNVDLSGRVPSVKPSEADEATMNDVSVAGFSDQILRFISQRGDADILAHVDATDKRYNLPQNLPGVNGGGGGGPRSQVEAPLPLVCQIPRWRVSRVFISSTFRDMHGERDLLTRCLFPQLRRECRKMFVELLEVDLRWGVTEEEARRESLVPICLDEVRRCDLFIGLLGDRYGFTPASYAAPADPAFDWVRDCPPGRSITELEMRHALQRHGSDQAALRSTAFFCLREPLPPGEVPAAWRDWFESEPEPEKRRLLAELRSMVQHSGCVVHSYSGRWGLVLDGRPLLTGLEDLGGRLYASLLLALQARFCDGADADDDDDEDGGASTAAFVDEAEHTEGLQAGFLQRQQADFVGRETQVKALKKLLGSVRSGVVPVVGQPGCGKTAFMAHAVRAACQPVWSIAHFVGASPGSNFIHPTLQRICHELARRFGLGDLPAQCSFKSLVERFSELLTAVGKRGKFTIFIDGFELMEDINEAKSFSWLPVPLPENIVAVITVNANSTVHKSLLRRPDKHEFSLGVLDVLDRSEIMQQMLAKFSKSLDEAAFNNQMRLITGKKQSGLPAYLRLVCDEIRLLGLHESLSEQLKQLPQTLPQLVSFVLARLETQCGVELVSAAACLLLLARDGLSESELRLALSVFGLLKSRQQLGSSNRELDDSAEQQQAVEPGMLVPQLNVAQLVAGLGALLGNGGVENAASLIRLQGEDACRAVRERYLAGAAAAAAESFCHRVLAHTFLLRCNRPASFDGADGRALAELPYHLERSLKYGLLESLLTNLDFLKAKCTQGNPRDLLENYLGVANPNGPMLRERKKMEASQRFQDYKQFAFDCVNHLTKYPELIYQLALNYYADSAVCQDAESALSGRAARGRAARAIVWRNKDDLQPANGGNIACQLTLDGFSSTPTCLAADSVGALAVGTIDGDVVLRQSDTGREIKSLSGHSAEVTAVCFVGAGAGRLATASKDGFVNLWDSGAGVRLANLKGHVRRVTALVANPRGDLFASAGLDGFVLLRNAATGELSYHFRTKSPINCAAFHPEGKLLAAGCWDASVKLLDSLAHSRTAVLRGHRAAVRAVAFSRHTGGHLVSGSMDGELRVWDTATGVPVGLIRSAGLPATALMFSLTGEHLVTADTGLRPALWSSGLGRLVCAIGDSSDEAGRPATSADRVMSLAADAGFSLLASGSHSGRVRLHRPFTGQPVAELRIRSDYASVGALQFAPGGGDSCQLYCGCDDAALRLLRVAFDSAGKRTLQLVSTSGRAGRGGHSGRVTALACAPGLVMSASEDCTARLWDAGLRECSTVFNHHKGAVLACALAPDGSLGFTGANDASILVYDLSDKSLVHTEPQAHGDWVTSLDCFRATDSAESELRLVSGSNDFSVKLWRVQPDSHSLSQLLRLTGHVSAVSCVRGLPNCLASSCSGGELKLWTYTEASAGGKVRAVGVEATTLYGAEQRSNACLLARPPTVSAAAKSSAAAAKTSAAAAKTSAAATAAAAASSKSKKSKKKLPASPSSSSEEEDSDDGGAVKVSLDDIDFGRGGCGRGGGGGDWDAQVDEDKQRATMRKRQIAPTDRRPAEAVVVCGASDDGVVRVHQPLLPNPLGPLTGHSAGPVSGLAACSGRFLASLSAADATVRTWRIADRPLPELGQGAGHAAPVTIVCYLPDCGAVASGGLDGCLLLWEAPAGRLLARLRVHDSAVCGLAWQPEGHLLIACQGLPGCLLRLATIGLAAELSAIAGRSSAPSASAVQQLDLASAVPDRLTRLACPSSASVCSPVACLRDTVAGFWAGGLLLVGGAGVGSRAIELPAGSADSAAGPDAWPDFVQPCPAGPGAPLARVLLRRLRDAEVSCLEFARSSGGSSASLVRRTVTSRKLDLPVGQSRPMRAVCLTQQPLRALLTYGCSGRGQLGIVRLEAVASELSFGPQLEGFQCHSAELTALCPLTGPKTPDSGGLFATGSADGEVKVWRAKVRGDTFELERVSMYTLNCGVAVMEFVEAQGERRLIVGDRNGGVQFLEVMCTRGEPMPTIVK
ncbi:hypothetical protein BOX15_Mlig031198g5 [Macrostomum lignano]|uniref:WD_REPEATS_REGION domain-containing protein n=1 Tax=Macrostomum lignano TaxID=282301 RepID=A0A267H0U1_9PLAT|nr:hypothetical protein BOX15_Mlig031198g5 [Macrostomum lignano]